MGDRQLVPSTPLYVIRRRMARAQLYDYVFGTLRRH